MRPPLAFIIVIACGVGGCGDDTTMSGGDLAAAGADLAVPADLSTLSCSRILACVAGCGQSLLCQANCRAAGTTAARSAYDAFTGCVALGCSSVDGGTAACTSATDARSSCQTCLQSIATQAPSSGAACNREYTTCAGN